MTLRKKLTCCPSRSIEILLHRQVKFFLGRGGRGPCHTNQIKLYVHTNVECLEKTFTHFIFNIYSFLGVKVIFTMNRGPGSRSPFSLPGGLGVTKKVRGGVSVRPILPGLETPPTTSERVGTSRPLTRPSVGVGTWTDGPGYRLSEVRLLPCGPESGYKVPNSSPLYSYRVTFYLLEGVLSPGRSVTVFTKDYVKDVL